MQVQPYLYFDGRCEEAIEFYRQVLGAEVKMMMRFKENPNPERNPAGSDDKVMHMAVRIGESTLFASDGNCRGEASFQGFSLALTTSDSAEAERIFTALSEGGQIYMPIGETFFSPRFGMVTDRFGVSWTIIAKP